MFRFELTIYSAKVKNIFLLGHTLSYLILKMVVIPITTVKANKKIVTYPTIN